MIHSHDIKKILFIAIFAVMAMAPKDAIALDDDSYAAYAAATSLSCPKAYDPYENFNRKIFILNGIMDAIITRPIAIAYNKVTNDFVRRSITNALSNMREPVTMVNYMLQGRPADSVKSFWRFTVNSTVGLVGLFDVARGFGIKTRPQTLNNTLAYYGVGPGPYIVLPVFGAMNARSITDPLFSNSRSNIVKYYLHSDVKSGLAITNIIAQRDQIMPFTEHVTKFSQDPYITMRDSYYQNSEAKMAYPENFHCPIVK